MRIGNTHNDVRPDEFQVAIAGESIISAEWRAATEATEQGFATTVHAVNKCVAATAANAKKLLMLCKYPDPSAEVALMRRADDDAEKTEHEAYHDRVAEYVATLGLT